MTWGGCSALPCLLERAGSLGGSPNTPASHQIPVGLGSGARSAGAAVRARAAAAAASDRVRLAPSAAAVPSVSKAASDKPGFVDAACQYSVSRLAAAARWQAEQEQEQAASEQATDAAGGAGGADGCAGAEAPGRTLVDAAAGGDEMGPYGDDDGYDDDGGDDYAGAGGDDDMEALDGSEQQQQEEEATEGDAAAARAAAAGAGSGDAGASPAPRLPAAEEEAQEHGEEDGGHDDDCGEWGGVQQGRPLRDRVAWEPSLQQCACSSSSISPAAQSLQVASISRGGTVNRGTVHGDSPCRGRVCDSTAHTVYVCGGAEGGGLLLAV